jgi:hypothetical protein
VWENNLKGSLLIASDQFICIIGGHDSDGNVSSLVEVRSLIDFNKVETTFEMKYPRVDPVAALDSDSKRLLICSGANCEHP